MASAYLARNHFPFKRVLDEFNLLNYTNRALIWVLCLESPWGAIKTSQLGPWSLTPWTRVCQMALEFEEGNGALKAFRLHESVLHALATGTKMFDKIQRVGCIASKPDYSEVCFTFIFFQFICFLKNLCKDYSF